MENLTQTKNPANTTKWIGVISEDKQKKKRIQNILTTVSKRSNLTRTSDSNR